MGDSCVAEKTSSGRGGREVDGVVEDAMLLDVREDDNDDTTVKDDLTAGTGGGREGGCEALGAGTGDGAGLSLREGISGTTGVVVAGGAGEGAGGGAGGGGMANRIN